MSELPGETAATCSYCGARLFDGQTCQDYFNQLLHWEFDEPQSRFEVHHLMVLCYHLQHPDLYSAEALIEAKILLGTFLGNQRTIEEIRLQGMQKFASSNRNWKVRANESSSGSYDQAMEWSKTIEYVVSGGADDYVMNVKAWANEVFDIISK